MIVFLYGLGTYSRGEKARELSRAYLGKRSASGFGRFDLALPKSEAEEAASEKETSESVLGPVMDFFKNRSLFDPKKFALVSFSEYGSFKKVDVAWLKEMAEAQDASLVLSCPKPPVKACAFLLEKPVTHQEFKRLAGADLHAAIMRLASARGVRVSDKECGALDALCSGDLGAIATELDMMALMPEGERAVGTADAFDFFGAMGRMAQAPASWKLPALYRMSIANDGGKIFNILSAFVSGEKKRLMADHDAAIKSGLLDYEVALADFAIR